jgi:hypothetical protein
MSIFHEIAGPFEVHLTVDAVGDHLRALSTYCKARGWKCIHILLDRGRTPSQPMVTYHDSGTCTAVVDRTRQVIADLTEQGFAVTRTKLETSPTARGVPQIPGEPNRPGSYFEHHLKLLRRADEPTEPLRELVMRHTAHLSRNAFCMRTDGHEERFVTLRHLGVDRTTSMLGLDSLMTDLRAAGHHWLSVESEYSVHDSNRELDAGWLTLE